jgi:hypothetical protein
MTVSLSDMHLDRAATPAVLDGPVSIAATPDGSFARLVDLLTPQPKTPSTEQGKASQPDPGKSATLSAFMVAQAISSVRDPETLQEPTGEKSAPDSTRIPERDSENSSIVADAPPQNVVTLPIPSPLFANVEPALKRGSDESPSVLPARDEPAPQPQAGPLPGMTDREARAGFDMGPSLSGALAEIDMTTAPAGVAAPAASANPPRTIHVDELSSHFPVMLANLAPPSAPAIEPSMRDGAAPTTALMSAPVTRFEPVRILRFAIEPAELGALSVKIRVSHMRVEIQIDAQSSTAATLLVQARDALIAALDQKGMALQAFDVTTQIAPVTASAPTDGLAGGWSDDQNAGFGAQSRSSSGDGAGQDQRRQTPDRERRDPEKTPLRHGSYPAGVVL